MERAVGNTSVKCNLHDSDLTQNLRLLMWTWLQVKEKSSYVPRGETQILICSIVEQAKETNLNKVNYFEL